MHEFTITTPVSTITSIDKPDYAKAVVTTSSTSPIAIPIAASKPPQLPLFIQLQTQDLLGLLELLRENRIFNIQSGTNQEQQIMNHDS